MQVLSSGVMGAGEQFLRPGGVGMQSTQSRGTNKQSSGANIQPRGVTMQVLSSGVMGAGGQFLRPGGVGMQSTQSGGAMCAGEHVSQVDDPNIWLSIPTSQHHTCNKYQMNISQSSVLSPVQCSSLHVASLASSPSVKDRPLPNPTNVSSNPFQVKILTPSIKVCGGCKKGFSRAADGKSCLPPPRDLCLVRKEQYLYYNAVYGRQQLSSPSNVHYHINVVYMSTNTST